LIRSVRVYDIWLCVAGLLIVGIGLKLADLAGGLFSADAAVDAYRYCGLAAGVLLAAVSLRLALSLHQPTRRLWVTQAFLLVPGAMLAAIWLTFLALPLLLGGGVLCVRWLQPAVRDAFDPPDGVSAGDQT
jgi:hypothetical protein